MIRLADPAASRAVLVGVGTYADPQRWAPLPAVPANLEDLAAVLTDPRYWGLPPANLTGLLDPADAGAVLEAIAVAAEAARDTVVIYYAGHGSIDDASSELLLPVASTNHHNRRFNRKTVATMNVVEAWGTLALVALISVWGVWWAWGGWAVVTALWARSQWSNYFNRLVLTTERIMTISGVIRPAARSIPLNRIPDTPFRQDLLERSLNLGTFTIRSADTRADLVVPGVPRPYAVYRRIFEEIGVWRP